MNIPSASWLRNSSKRFAKLHLNPFSPLNLEKYREKLWIRIFKQCEIPEVFCEFAQELSKTIKFSKESSLVKSKLFYQKNPDILSIFLW